MWTYTLKRALRMTFPQFKKLIKYRVNRWLKNKHGKLTVSLCKWFIPILIESDGISLITLPDLLGPEDAWGFVCSTKTMRLRSTCKKGGNPIGQDQTLAQLFTIISQSHMCIQPLHSFEHC